MSDGFLKNKPVLCVDKNLIWRPGISCPRAVMRREHPYKNHDKIP